MSSAALISAQKLLAALKTDPNNDICQAIDLTKLEEILGRADMTKASSSSAPSSASSSSAPSSASSEDELIPFDVLGQFMFDVFTAYGVPEKEAKISADVLLQADIRGIDSHGIGRLKPIYCDRIDQGILHPIKPITLVSETTSCAVVDGNGGMGLYVGPYCMELAIKKAKENGGLGMVLARNSTHYGIAGYYATMATEQGCIGFTGTNARPSIAPTFGVEPMLGTNPLCFGIPTNDGYPFVIDCATSVNQRGKIERYGREGKSTPPGAVIDENGNTRTDTLGILEDMVKGKCALCPVGGVGEDTGGYKGYGWATVVELLCTSAQSGPFGEELCGVDRKTGAKKSMPLGHFFLAIDVGAFCDVDTFKKNSSNLLNALRNSKKSPNPDHPDRIWTAGEKEHDAEVERTAQGGVMVGAALQKNMIDLRNRFPDSLGKKYAKFSFEK